VVIALLSEPEAAHKVTELAKQAHVAPATAQKTVFALEHEGLLDVTGRGPQKIRHVRDAAALLERYAEDARADRRKAVRCRVLGDELEEIARSTHERLYGAHVSAVLTGPSAAALEAPALTAYPVTEFWFSGSRSARYLLEALDAVEADSGANVILWRAGSKGPLAEMRFEPRWPAPLASPFRIYADLLANPQRGAEQASVYREQVIGF
jgi:DNA-binding transcriptional regulator YhcF (GntR family)